MSKEKNEYEYNIKELRQTLAWMDIVLSNISDSVCVVNSDGVVIFVNDSLAEILNKPRLYLIGQNIEKVLLLKPKTNSFPKPFPLQKPKNKREKVLGIYEWQIVNQDSVSVRLTTHYIEPTQQVVIMLQDITNEFELEEISRNFTHLASHQLRTPLTAIKTHAHMLSDGYLGKLNTVQQDSSTTILDAANHMNELLSMLIDISKLDSNRYVRHMESVYIEEIIQRILTENKGKVKEKELAIKIEIPTDLQPVISDAYMLHEVFSNIITNAIKYTAHRGEVSISLIQSQKVVTVEVKDNGIGIPKKSQDKIFTQFFRAENAVDSARPGTGLGLYLVKHLVELLGGKITFHSIYKVGTTFRVTLPSRPT
ncbi:PAS domain-containing sensor histidine kinase [Candidatus Saccharibacteria bacterium]|nr:PAS domain-containing sensor histidine kinase [Candidatus Saccharibacteria bacterium]